MFENTDQCNYMKAKMLLAIALASEDDQDRRAFTQTAYCLMYGTADLRDAAENLGFRFSRLTDQGKARLAIFMEEYARGFCSRCDLHKEHPEDSNWCWSLRKEKEDEFRQCAEATHVDWDAVLRQSLEKEES